MAEIWLGLLVISGLIIVLFLIFPRDSSLLRRHGPIEDPDSGSDRAAELIDFVSHFNASFDDYSEYKLKSSELRSLLLGRTKDLKALDKIDELAFLKSKIRDHYSALRRNTEKRIKKNDYGAVVRDDREREIQEFFASIAYVPTNISRSEAIGLTLGALEEIAEQLSLLGFDPESLPEDGHSFEAWIAEGLRALGWKAETTSFGADQGVDVIAQKNGLKLGIQCKLYTTNVGNKAVQEIISAKKYFDLHESAVISNAAYTKSAQELASKCNVKLLSHYDLPRLDDIYFNKKQHNSENPTNCSP